MKIGFVGLGQLGSRLCTILLENDYDVIVSDLDSSAVSELVKKGAAASESLSKLGGSVEIVITCLPSPQASVQVMCGEQGLMQAMRPNSTWIEMSTTSVDEIQRMDVLASEQGIFLLEAPLTGGIHRAATGEMTILAGGDKPVFQKHSGLLELLGGKVIYMGEVGSASLIKVITNLLCLVDLVATGEALMLAKKGNLDLGKCYEAICASSGTSREFEDWAPVILNGSLNTGFTTDLGLKDLGFVADLGEQHGVPLRLTHFVKALFEQSRDKYGGDAWTPHVVKMLEDEVGEELRAEGFPDVIQT